MDLQHRSLQAHARDFAFDDAFQFAGVVPDIGRSTAHIEADQFSARDSAADRDAADDAARRTGEQAIATAKGVRFAQSAVGLHKVQTRRPALL